MTTRHVKGLLVVFLLLPGLVGSTMAGAAEVEQTLDQVKVFSAEAVLNMTFNDPNRGTVGYTAPPLETAGPLVACKLTGDGGFYCLAGQLVIAWPNGPQSPQSYDLFDCTAQAQLAVTSCTGLTVDDDGTIWLAGKNKARTHSLVQVVKELAGADTPATCPEGTFASAQTNPSGRYDCFTATTRYTGRPTLVDIDVVRDEAGAVEGIIGLEERKTVVYFTARGEVINTPKEVVVGKAGEWALSAKLKEELQSVTLVAPQLTHLQGRRYALVATSQGRILAKRFLIDATSSEAVIPVYDRTIEACTDPLGTPKFALRSSATSDVVYVTDRACREALALKPQTKESTFDLDFATERRVNEPIDGTAIYDPPLDEPAAPVPPLSTGDYPPEGLTPGIGLGFNVGGCTASLEAGACQPVHGFRLWGIDGAPDAGVTLFKVENLPDCRYAARACRAELGLPVPASSVCGGPGKPRCDANDPCGETGQPTCSVYTEDLILDGRVIFDRDGAGHPAAQYLNVTPLLDEDITSLYDDSGEPPYGLPPLLISPYFRGQADNGYLFEAFFVKPEPGLTFTGKFEGLFDVAELAGRENGCIEYSTFTPLSDLLYWDVVTKASEVHQNVLRLGAYPDDLGASAHTDVLLNTGCGSSRYESMNLSLIAYNMEPTPDTYIPERTDDPLVENNDAVFARMVGRLHDDLGQVLLTLACDSNLQDNTSMAPLKDADCLVLKSAWQAADQQLQRCLDATYQPKASASNQNCQSFLEQFGKFKSALAPVTPNAGYDVANRRGELDVRIRVFEHVYATRFVPSIPRGGFCVESGTCVTTAP